VYQLFDALGNLTPKDS